MTVRLDTFDVRRSDTDEVRRIDLVEGLDDVHLRFITREWSPRLLQARDRAVLAYQALPLAKRSEGVWQEKQGMFGAPDSHWSWVELNQSMLGSVNRIFTLLDRDEVQALMRIDLSKSSRVHTSQNTPIVYVDNLAVAPWNRPSIQSPQRFKGLGKMLLGVAVVVSIQEDMKGRCGLHSLLQSEGFYTGCGMRDCGIEAGYEMRYFEFDPESAKKFMEG